jgi:hypothetical protein
VGISHHLPTFYPPFSHHLPTKSASLGRVLGFLMTSGLREVVRGLAKNRRAPGGVAEVNTPGVYIIIYIMIKNNYILTIFNYIYILILIMMMMMMLMLMLMLMLVMMVMMVI